MGNIYVTCARCNKGMTIAEYNCVFCSDIDNQFVCADCYKKEQPKELMKKIQELESKIKESENFYKDLGFKDEKDARDYLIDCITQPKDLVEDVRKLKQQLAEKEKEIEKLTKSFAQKNNEDLSTTINGVKFTTEQIIALQQVGYSAEYDKNQTAIAELNNILDTFAIFVNEEKESMVSPDGNGNLSLLEYIENRIDTLKGEK